MKSTLKWRSTGNEFYRTSSDLLFTNSLTPFILALESFDFEIESDDFSEFNKFWFSFCHLLRLVFK